MSESFDNLPQYDTLEFETLPPDYTPSLHHISLVYYNDESKCNGKISYLPLLFELNSTQINFYNLKDEYSRLVAYLFNDLHSTFVDPNLNIKSKHASKLNIMGQGIGSSASLFSIPDSNNSNSNIIINSLQPVTPPPLLFNNKNNKGNNNNKNSISNNSSNSSSILSSSSSSSSLSTMFSSNTTFSGYIPSIPSNPRTNSSLSTFSNVSSSSFTKFFDKLSLKKNKSDSATNFNSVILSETEKQSQDLIYLQKLLNFKPDINSILDVDYSPQEAQLLNFKSSLFKSFSLQELIRFGNASDFHTKPFALRLIFPTDQFIMISYNANQFASIFYKLNIAKELSLDFDLRVTSPIDYCVPRRSRNRNRRNRNRSNSNLSNPISRTTSNRSRSNSLLDQDDDEDEFDTTFNIETQPHLDYQPQQSIQPQIILEDEILDDIIQLEPAQQVLSSLSYVSRVTTTGNSVFSSVERFSSQITDVTMMSSLSPICSRNEDDELVNDSIINSTTVSELPPLEKIPEDNFPQSSYKELVFAIKCIRSCKNKTLPWMN